MISSMSAATRPSYTRVTLAIGDERMLDHDFLSPFVHDCTADLMRLSKDPAVTPCFASICGWIGTVLRGVVHFWPQCAEVAYRMLVFSVPRLFNQCDMSDPHYVTSLSSIATTLRSIKKCVAITPYQLAEGATHDNGDAAPRDTPTAEASMKRALQRLHNRFDDLDRHENPLSVADMIESCFTSLPSLDQVQSCTSVVDASLIGNAACDRHPQVIESLFNAAFGFDVPMFCVIRTSWYRFLAMVLKKVVCCNTCTTLFRPALKHLKSVAYHASLVEADDAFDPSPPVTLSDLVIWQAPTSQIAPSFALFSTSNDPDIAQPYSADAYYEVMDKCVNQRSLLSEDLPATVPCEAVSSSTELDVDRGTEHDLFTVGAVEENPYVRRSTRRHVQREVFPPLLVKAAVTKRVSKDPKSRRYQTRRSNS